MGAGDALARERYHHGNLRRVVLDATLAIAAEEGVARLTWDRMRYAITGGAGFIGRRLVAQLRAAGHEVVCVARNPDRAAELGALGASVVRGDILDRASLAQAFRGADGVFHLAASYVMGVTGARADEALRTNLDGTRFALEAAHEVGVPRIVYTSSTVIYGDTRGRTMVEGDVMPEPWFPTHYAMSKARAHHDVAVPLQRAGLPIVITQPGAVIGRQDHSAMRTVFALAARGWPVPVGTSTFAVVDVDECARGHVLAMEKGRVGESYHLVAEVLTLGELVERVGKVSGLRTRSVTFPTWMLRLQAAMTSLVEPFVSLPEAFTADGIRGSGGVDMKIDNSKARRELGFDPRPLDAAIAAIVQDELDLAGGRSLAASA